MMSANKMLLISGEGKIPSIVYQNALQKMVEVIWVGFRFLHYSREETPHHFMDTLSVASLVHLAKTFHAEYLCFAGKISRSFLFQEKYIETDLKQLRNQLSGYQDDHVLKAIFNEFKCRGLKLISPIEFLSDILTPLGSMTQRIPNEREWLDISYGIELARYLADHEVGQTIVLKRKAVLAVEAAEGTDATIQRGALLGSGDVVVVKVARTQQNFFVDVPTIGAKTIQTIGENGGGILAIEQGKTLVLDREEFLMKANELGVGVVGISVSLP